MTVHTHKHPFILGHCANSAYDISLYSSSPATEHMFAAKTLQLHTKFTQA